MPRFSNFLRKSTIHFCTCLYLVACFLRDTVSLLCRSQGRTISSSFINWNMYLLYSCNLHSNETVTVKKHVTKYTNMLKWMVEFLRKFESHCCPVCGPNQDVLIRRWNRFCDPMKKKNWCDVAERIRGSWLLITFLKPSLKMPSVFCEFGCYNRQLYVNKPISLIS